MKYKDSDDRKWREKAGCLTDCVAFIMNRHFMNVPMFVQKHMWSVKRNGRFMGWQAKLKSYFTRNGRKLVNGEVGIPKKGTAIVIGSVPHKNFTHAVVYENGKMVFDPSYPTKWRDSRYLFHFEII